LLYHLDQDQLQSHIFDISSILAIVIK
jgi:hypothetical protein